MAFPTIPTIEEIKDRIIADLDTALNQSTPAFAKSFNRKLAGALAAVFALAYQVAYWVYRQIFIDTADDDTLADHGELVDVYQESAVKAVLIAAVPGTEGTTVPEDTKFKSAAGYFYKVTTSGDVGSAGYAEVTLTATESGESGNLADGSELDIVSPVTGLDGTCTIESTETSGDDAETTDSFRSRISSAYKKSRTGGSPADYESWGLETPNFDWVSPVDSEDLPGDITVYGKVDNQTDGIPTDDQLLELESYLKSSDPDDTAIRDRHPIGPGITVEAITRHLFDVTVYIQDGTTAIEEDIEDAITSYVEDNRYPYNEAIDSSRADTISEGGISSAASDVADTATVTAVILKETSTSNTITSYTLYGGEFAKINSITFEDVV